MRYISKISDIAGNDYKFVREHDGDWESNIDVYVKNTETGYEYRTSTNNLYNCDVDYGFYTEPLGIDRYRVVYKYDESLIALENCISFIKEEFRTDLRSDTETFTVNRNHRLILSPFVDEVLSDFNAPVTVAEVLWKILPSCCFLDNMSKFYIRGGIHTFDFYSLSEEGRILLAKLRLLT